MACLASVPPTEAGRLTDLMRLLRRHLTLTLIVGGYVLTGFAWTFASPPGTHPDADAHYTRAIALSRGQLIGRPYNGPPLDPSRFRLGQARVFRVPAGLAAPSSFDCDAGNLDYPSICAYVPPDVHGITSQVSVEGTNSPLGYLLPALLMTLAKGPNGAELIGSIVSLVTSLVLLGTAAALLWSRRPPLSPLIGYVLAVTPMVMFLSGALGPDGLELTASICFIAGLLRLTRDESAPAWTIVATAIAAFVLSLARPLGFGWVALDLVSWALMFARRETLRTVTSRMAGRIGLAVTAAGVLFALGWESVFRLHPYGGFGNALSLVPGVFDLVPQYFADFVGRFGSSDTPLPQPLVEPWIACVIVVVGVAIAVGTRRERAGMVAMLVFSVIGVVGYAAAFDSLTGGGLPFAQARHILPLVLMVPLFAGEIISRRADRLGGFKPKRLFVSCAVVAAVVNVGAIYYDARRYAVGNKGSLLYFLPNASAWAPKGQWIPVLLAALIGGILIVLAAVLDTRAFPRSDRESDVLERPQQQPLTVKVAG